MGRAGPGRAAARCTSDEELMRRAAQGRLPNESLMGPAGPLPMTRKLVGRAGPMPMTRNIDGPARPGGTPGRPTSAGPWQAVVYADFRPT